MSVQPSRRRHESTRWCIEVMRKPWFIDILTYVLVGVWMAWTFATIQQYGPSPALLGSAVVVLAAGLLLIYNQRIAYLRIGDWLVIGTKEPVSDDSAPWEE